MEMNEEVLLNGEKVVLPTPATEEEMNDLLLLDEDIPTKDLSEVLENTKEIDWGKNE